MKYIKSPLKYVGHKYKLLDQILPLFPKDRKVFIDLFTGSGTVAVNVVDNFKTVIANDINEYLMKVFYVLQAHFEDLLDVCFNMVKYYKLSCTYKYGTEIYKEISRMNNSDKYLFLYNKKGFEELKADFNKLIKTETEISFNMIAMYFLLNLYGFNGLVRFNNKGLCNHTAGACDLNLNVIKNLKEFSQGLNKGNVCFRCEDFKNLFIMPERMVKDTFIYADPPYYNTKANYNKYWNENDFHSLLFYLQEYSKLGGKFALSELMESADFYNIQLMAWIERNNYKIHDISVTYHNCVYNKKNREINTKEILVTNY